MIQMDRWIGSLFFGMVLFGCEAKVSVPPGIESIPDNAEVTEYPGNTGLVRVMTRDAEGNISAYGDYLDGKRDGSWSTLHSSSGIVTSIENYRAGLKVGTSIFLDQGNVSRIENYLNGALEGEYRVYDSRRLIEVGSYREGKLHGVVKKYYSNGKVMQEAPYSDGKLNGIAKWYDEAGNLTIAYEYEDNKLTDQNARSKAIPE